MDDRDNRQFVSKVLSSEADCIRYLQDFGLFSEAPTCKDRNEIGCGTKMRETTRLRKGEKVPFWQCPKRACRTYCSAQLIGFLATQIYMVNRNGKYPLLMYCLLKNDCCGCSCSSTSIKANYQ